MRHVTIRHRWLVAVELADGSTVSGVSAIRTILGLYARAIFGRSN